MTPANQWTNQSEARALQKKRGLERRCRFDTDIKYINTDIRSIDIKYIDIDITFQICLTFFGFREGFAGPQNNTLLAIGYKPL